MGHEDTLLSASDLDWELDRGQALWSVPDRLYLGVGRDEVEQ